MNSRWRVSVIVAIGSLVSVVFSSQAAARPFEASFSVNTSSGYRISVTGWHDTVRVLVIQDPVRISRNVIATEYVGHGTTSPAGIEADLGSLGSIAMRFRPSATGKIVRSPKNCSPHQAYRRPGTFSGSFRFTGEASYAAFEATEVKGSIGTPEDFICATFGPSNGPLMLYLNAGTSRRYLSSGFLAFAALRKANDPRYVEFTAESREQVEGLSVRRFVSEVARASSFLVGSRLHRATVTPPAPFSGSASFRRPGNGGTSSWSGSLSVSFLGKPDVPLTGPGFRFVALDRSRF
jgi:hypothetical protein